MLARATSPEQLLAGSPLGKEAVTAHLRSLCRKPWSFIWSQHTSTGAVEILLQPC